ncbi:MAG: hypothetical protein HFG16_07605 [Erysipelotrichaceae bacterium]|jgi:hypothetical protein|nr:hypothetical protein [Erysipelotrichaceae bacterium]
MKRSAKELQSEFMNIQHKGKQTLRLFLLFFLLVLFAYCGVQGYLLSLIYPDFNEHAVSYGFKILWQLMWLLPVWHLWKYRRIGKILYFLCLLFAFYECRNMYAYVLEETEAMPSVVWISLSLACLWRLFLVSGQIKLIHNAKIRSIWSVYDMFDEELRDEEEEIVIVPQKEETPLERKAKTRLHNGAVRMGISLYAFFIIVFVLLMVCKIQLPELKEGIEIIERTIFGNFLFTAFLWILPIAAMYMYHALTRWLLAACLLAELIKAIASWESYAYIVTSDLVLPFAQYLFAGIEIFRFFLLIWWGQKILRDPYCYYFWQKARRERE